MPQTLPGDAFDAAYLGAQDDWMNGAATGGSPSMRLVMTVTQTYGASGGADNAVQQRLDDAAAESARADGAARAGDHGRARDLYHSAHQMLHSAQTMHLASRPESSVHARAGGEALHSALAATMGAAQYHAEQNSGVQSAGVLTLDVGCEECAERAEEFAEDDRFGPTGKSVSNAPWDGAASRFTDEQYRMACAVCEPGGTPKQSCHLPHHEPGGAVNRNGVHAAAGRLNQISGGDKGKAAAHLRSHYTQDLNEEPPDSLTAAAVPYPVTATAANSANGFYTATTTTAATSVVYSTTMAETSCPTCKGSGKIRGGKVQCPECKGSGEMGHYAHERFTGTHTHAHSPYGKQGGDVSHEHSHTHNHDNGHSHTHPQGIDAAWEWAAEVSGRAWRTEATPERAAWHDRLLAAAAGLVASATTRRPTWSVRQGPDGWTVLTAAGTPWGEAVPTYADALEVIGRAVADGGQGVLSQPWRSDMAFEGLSTGDGRFINKGATSFRNCPMPYMLQTETAPGHMGADLAGFITQAGMVGAVASGGGNFLANDAGRQQVQILDAVARYGVSIDVAEAEGQPVCAEHGDNLEECSFGCPWEMHFSKIVVMGLTGTPFPAFADAYIELASQPPPVTASAAPGGVETDVEDFSEDDPFDVPVLSVTAAGVSPDGRARPPAAWFAMPELRVGDPRLVRQESGAWACPLTVEKPDPITGLRRFYGHVADRLTCHTGIVDRCQLVPKDSPTGYAVFNKRPILTAEGDTVRVGPISMGCGHAPTKSGLRLTVDQIQAHYDGGPGAVRMGWAHAGSDQYAPWIAGVIAPERTEEQVEEFAMLSLSGDWREVYRGKPIEMVACLAGVFSPGFPLAASLVAAGLPAPVTAGQLPDGPEAEFAEDGRCVALVAAGVVRQPYPWERQLATVTRDVEALREALALVESTVGPLTPFAAEAIQAKALGYSPPTPADRAVSAALQRIAAALRDATAAQAKDTDADNDPDDVKVAHGLAMLGQLLAQVISDQAKDAAADPR